MEQTKPFDIIMIIVMINIHLRLHVVLTFPSILISLNPAMTCFFQIKDGSNQLIGVVLVLTLLPFGIELTLRVVKKVDSQATPFW